jgi:Protein of unknown function (DUF2971)
MRPKKENMLIFKYVSPDATPNVLERPNELSIRFGLPNTYNDPYELFLQPDHPLEDEEERAFYDYFLGEVVEAPVACFSRRPESLVMWAHYGRECAGICPGFDEDAILDQFPIAYVGDVEYADGPATISAKTIKYAYATGKRGQTLRLLETGHRAAYFRKRIDWQYEAERRIVVTPDAVEDRNGILLGRVSPGALRYIILGTRTAPSIKELCQGRAQQWDVSVIELRIGLKTFVPFFTSPEMLVRTWSGAEFESVANVCEACGEPADWSESGKCLWCSTTVQTKDSAARRSLLTLPLSLGIDKGIPLVFDGMRPRGRLATEALSVFHRPC